MTDEIDDMVRAAAKAHEALAGADYFDGLEARVLARLERDESFASEVSMMSDTPPSKDSTTGGDEARRAGTTDDSGLHDMKALAETAKRRISRRITSQHDAYDESLLSSSHSGLRAVALPVSAQIVSLPEAPSARAGSDGEATASRATASDVGSVTPISAAAEKKKSKAMWLVGGGLLAAAAAAVVVMGGGGDKKPDPGGVVASAEGERAAAAGAAPATGSAVALPAPAAIGGEPLAQPVAPPPAEIAADSNADSDKGGAKLEERAQEKEAAKQARGDGAAAPLADKPKKTTDGKDAAKAGPGAGTAAPPADKSQGKKPTPADKPAATTGDQTIDDLLNAASGGAQKPTEGGGGGGEAKPEKTALDSKDIKAGMSSVAGKAQSCFDQHGVAGLVKVKATVDPSGKVTKVDATGEFAGTPTGACVAGHVKSASFASWTGAPMTINYGFTLQE